MLKGSFVVCGFVVLYDRGSCLFIGIFVSEINGYVNYILYKKVLCILFIFIVIRNVFEYEFKKLMLKLY